MDNISLEHTAPPLPQRALSELCRLLRLACRWALPLLLALAEGGRAATSLDSLSNRTSVAPPGSLDYVILDSETTSGHSNIQAQASFTMDNPTGAAVRTNVLQFRVINAATGNPHPIYDFGNTTTNLNYTYNITNRLSFLGATPQTLSTNAFIRPAAWMDQFTPFYIECTMFTNGIVVNQRATPPANYYHFTNTVSGDDAYNVRLNFTNAAWSRTYAVQTILGQNTFQVSAGYEVRRWDDFNAAISAASIPIVFNYTLRDAGGNTVPLVTSSQTFHDSVTNYLLDVLQYPTFQTGQHTLDIQPAAQLDSVTKTYYLTVTLAHINNPVTGQVLTANTQQTVALELLHFNGNLSFGAINTTMTSLGGSPPTNAPSGSIIQTTLPSVGGLVTANQAGIFTAANLVVNLDSLGNPVVTSGSATLLSANDSLAQVNFQRSGTLSSAGASGNITLNLPTGFGYRLNDMNSQVLQSTIQFSNPPLTPALIPTFDLTYSPGGTIYAVEEDKPVWLVSDHITWHVNTGTFDIPPTGAGAICVRASRFAFLNSVSNLVVDPPAMGDKRSNDKYWLALTGANPGTTVQPDLASNALLTANFTFGPGDYRSHFPYNLEVQWSGTGVMNVTNDLAQGGALQAAAPISVSYTRDCPDCGGGGAGLATLTLIPSNNVFNFTLDGGLIALGGTASAINLQWGFISAVSDYA